METLTGSRLKKLSNELKETFMLTYGDGLSNINLKKLLNFHKKNKKNNFNGSSPSGKIWRIVHRQRYSN